MDLELIKKSFYQYYGKKLSNLLDVENADENTTNRFINRQKEVMEEFCKSRNVYFDYEKLNELQKSKFDYILLEQMYWVLNNEDFTTVSGYDLVSSQGTPISEIVKRYVSPNVQRRLTNAGFCYRGIK